MSNKRKASEIDIQNNVFQSLLNKGQCTTSLSNVKDIIDDLDNIPIGLISANALCKHTFNVQAIADKRIVKKYNWNVVKKIGSIFDIGVSSALSFTSMSLGVINTLNYLPQFDTGTVLNYVNYIKPATNIAISGLLFNRIGVPIIDQVIPSKIQKESENLIDEDAIKCVKIYKNQDNLNCDENSVLSCRDAYIKYHYLEKGINMNMLYEYLNIPDNMYKIFVQYINYNENKEENKQIKASYENIKKLWVHVLIKSENSTSDFSLVVLMLINKVHPDEIYYSEWKETLLTLIDSVLESISTNTDMYNNCILSLAMMFGSLNYMFEDGDFEHHIVKFIKKLKKYKEIEIQIKNKVNSLYDLQKQLNGSQITSEHDNKKTKI